MVTNSLCLELQSGDDGDSQKVVSCGNHDDEVVSEAGVKCFCCTDVTVAKDGYIVRPTYVRYMRIIVLNICAPTMKNDPM